MIIKNDAQIKKRLNAILLMIIIVMSIVVINVNVVDADGCVDGGDNGNADDSTTAGSGSFPVDDSDSPSVYRVTPLKSSSDTSSTDVLLVEAKKQEKKNGLTSVAPPKDSSQNPPATTGTTTATTYDTNNGKGTDALNTLNSLKAAEKFYNDVPVCPAGSTACAKGMVVTMKNADGTTYTSYAVGSDGTLNVVTFKDGKYTLTGLSKNAKQVNTDSKVGAYSTTLKKQAAEVKAKAEEEAVDTEGEAEEEDDDEAETRKCDDCSTAAQLEAGKYGSGSNREQQAKTDLDRIQKDTAAAKAENDKLIAEKTAELEKLNKKKTLTEDEDLAKEYLEYELELLQKQNEDLKFEEDLAKSMINKLKNEGFEDFNEFKFRETFSKNILSQEYAVAKTNAERSAAMDNHFDRLFSKNPYVDKTDKTVSPEYEEVLEQDLKDRTINAIKLRGCDGDAACQDLIENPDDSYNNNLLEIEMKSAHGENWRDLLNEVDSIYSAKQQNTMGNFNGQAFMFPAGYGIASSNAEPYLDADGHLIIKSANDDDFLVHDTGFKYYGDSCKYAGLEGCSAMKTPDGVIWDFVRNSDGTMKMEKTTDEFGDEIEIGVLAKRVMAWDVTYAVDWLKGGPTTGFMKSLASKIDGRCIMCDKHPRFMAALGYLDITMAIGTGVCDKAIAAGADGFAFSRSGGPSEMWVTMEQIKREKVCGLFDDQITTADDEGNTCEDALGDEALTYVYKLQLYVNALEVPIKFDVPLISESGNLDGNYLTDPMILNGDDWDTEDDGAPILDWRTIDTQIFSSDIDYKKVCIKIYNMDKVATFLTLGVGTVANTNDKLCSKVVAVEEIAGEDEAPWQYTAEEGEAGTFVAGDLGSTNNLGSTKASKTAKINADI